MNPQIFREYDIRGVVGRDLTPEVAELVGRAFGSDLRERCPGPTPTVAVGRDNRPSSPELAAGVVRGLRSAGVGVVDVGTVPTPVLYFATVHFGTDAGVQITGSHNPPEYNGFKMTVAGRAIYGAAIQELRARIEDGRWESGSADLRGEDALGPYIADVTGRFELARPVKVVVDCGNGVGSLVAVPLLRGIGAQVIPLYCESDGTFPNHHPDPTVDEYIQDMIAAVRREGAELGVGFDGDADRVGAVDENGEVVRGDLLLLLFALDALERGVEPRKLVFDVKCSQAVPEVYASRGGEPLMWKTGHSLIKEKMKETGAPIAGELSGHICFADDYYGFDDAPYAACRLVELLARSDRPLSALVGDFPSYLSTPEIRVAVAEEEKFAIVARAVEHFRRSHEVIDVDGARVLFDGGWGLLRASNTQPVLVLRYEAEHPEALDGIRAALEGWLQTQGVAV